MVSTSGSKLLDDNAMDALKTKLFPLAHVLTPNKWEAETLIGRQLKTPQDVEQAAKELLQMVCQAVLIKGGHALVEATNTNNVEVAATLQYAQDYLISSEPPSLPGEERLCDASKGIWLRTKR